MRGAALYAGLTLNAVFLQEAVNAQWRGGGIVTLWLGPLVWGLFLVYAVYYVPARTGLGARELLEAQFGRWCAWGIWWVLLPLWALSLYSELSAVFAAAIFESLCRWEEASRISIDTRIATLWPWVVLTGLAGFAPLRQTTAWAGFLVKVSAVILFAAPFAYRDYWTHSLHHLLPAACCGEIWWTQDLVLWLAPALLFAGHFRDPGENVIRPALLGIVLPLTAGVTAAFLTVLGGLAEYGKRAAAAAGYITSLVTHGKPGAVKWILLTFTLLVGGRFCVCLLCERLHRWRRWWLVFPLTAALAWGVPGYPDKLAWQITATPFLALAGALCAGYLCRPTLAFSNTEQRLAAAAAGAGGVFGVIARHNHHESAFLAWLTGFLLTAFGLHILGVSQRCLLPAPECVSGKRGVFQHKVSLIIRVS
ncbi:MAG: hypothetical protein JNM66_21740 [Bryobacterales bacterium]|nr:hypothetical protein [Bryobacterales bacterium]